MYRIGDEAASEDNAMVDDVGNNEDDDDNVAESTWDWLTT